MQINSEEKTIKWEYFEILHELDQMQPPSLRICPKVTDHHINIMKKSFLKMKVSFAVQVRIVNNNFIL